VTDIYNPIVSIGMPVFNGASFIRQAIDSLLSQTFQSFELIISDNASVDETETICRDYMLKDSRIKYYRQKTNIGPTKNFEFVLNMASCKYFMWAAADDLNDLTFIEKLLKTLIENKDFVLVMSDISNINENGVIISSIKIDNIRIEHVSTNWETYRKKFFDVPTSNVFFCIYGLYVTSVIKKVELNFKNLVKNASGSEIPILAQVAMFGKIGSIQEPLKLYRRHSMSVYNLEQKNVSDLTFNFKNNLNKVKVLILIVLKSSIRFFDKINLWLSLIKTCFRLTVDYIKNSIAIKILNPKVKL
jgi:glycosyltransferase involved in cell wall biosynthesis